MYGIVSIPLCTHSIATFEKISVTLPRLGGQQCM